MWEYKGVIVKVVDGDTVDVSIDLGFRIATKQRLRLARINAPEMATSDGKAAKLGLTSMLPLGATVSVRSSKTDKYERWIAEVDLLSQFETVRYRGTNASDFMLANGMAVVYRG